MRFKASDKCEGVSLEALGEVLILFYSAGIGIVGKDGNQITLIDDFVGLLPFIEKFKVSDDK